MKILKTYTRAWVADLDSALPVYEAIVGGPADLRFPFEEAELAAVGDILLIAGTPEATDSYRGTIGPLVVDDIEAAEKLVVSLGGVLRAPTVTGPTGSIFYARHPDGTEVEYLQWTDEIVDRVINKVG